MTGKEGWPSGILANAVTMRIGVDSNGHRYEVIVGAVVPRHGERWDAFAHDWSTPDDGDYRPVRIGTFTDRHSAVDEVRGRAPSRFPRLGDRTMKRHHVVPQNPPPGPWNAHRPISGQDGYFWTFFSADSDVRVVYWGGCGTHQSAEMGVEVGTVRMRLPDDDARYAAYDTDDEWIAASNNPAALAAVVALHDRAARLAARRAVAEAREVTADRTSPADLRAFERCAERAGFLDWDIDFGRSQMPLSGRDGDPTPLSLLHELDVDPDPDGEIQIGLALRYVDAFRVAWREEILRIAREQIGTQ